MLSIERLHWEMDLPEPQGSAPVAACDARAQVQTKLKLVATKFSPVAACNARPAGANQAEAGRH